MIFREEKDLDIPEISNLHRQAFKGPDESLIVENLRKNNKLILSVVCEIEGRIVGHIAYSRVFYKKEPVGAGLGPVAVLPSFQRRGIGSKLIETGNQIVFSKGFHTIFVLGNPAYYSRFGFEKAKKQNYFSRYDPGGNNFLVLGNRLIPTHQKADVEYCKEFNI
ncbi:N-acetyltransferase [bacterium]|nr:MAG: N-acetyltransferase [bacterium]